MSQDRIWYELRIMGRWVILIPPLIILTFVLLGAHANDHAGGSSENLSSINREFRDGTSTISGFIDGVHR